MSRFDVAVLGSLHLDIVIEGAPLPGPDETVIGRSWRFACGGKGGNQAVSAARFGARTAMIGRVGADDFGAKLLANLDAHHVDRGGVAIDPDAGSGMSAAIIDNAGAYGAAVVSGANRRIAAAQWHDLSAAILLLQNEIESATAIAAARAFKAKGSFVILNAAPAVRFNADLVTCADLLVVNRIEASQLMDTAIDSLAAAAMFAGLFAERVPAVMVTLGSGGLMLQGRDGGPHHIPSHEVRQVSSHGAGDLFIGALAAEMARGETLHNAARFANAAAALFVSGHAPDRDAVLALL